MKWTGPEKVGSKSPTTVEVRNTLAARSCDGRIGGPELGDDLLGGGARIIGGARERARHVEEPERLARGVRPNHDLPLALRGECAAEVGGEVRVEPRLTNAVVQGSEDVARQRLDAFVVQAARAAEGGTQSR
jgi:hypothetical protein